ncbi:MAG: UDP-N-acetylmuramate--L-alanine ligase [Bacteroidota bacterium]|nr:UDP-N-acetylmuramate--L-alanine ligase [Bacteroidota bacterium]
MKRLEDFADAHLRIFDRPAAPPPDTLKDVYLIGICGTGMGSLAGLFHEAGYQVRGSDAATWPPMSDRLAAMQIPVHEGYDANNLDPRPDLVVVGNACTPTHPEAARVREEGWPQVSLSEAVAEYFIGSRRSLVVAGTHGKTTTTSLLAHVFRAAGKEPGFLVGGVMNNGDVSYAVGSGPHFIIEGDEYDTAYFDKRPKFLHYRQTTAIITSVEFDHADIYHSMEDYREAFGALAGIVPDNGLLVLCADNPEVLRLNTAARSRIRTYGLDRRDVDVTAVRVDTGSDGQRFDLVVDGEIQGRVWLPLSGRHNLLNALAVATVALDEGLSIEDVAKGFGTFLGIQRRQQIRGEGGSVIVVDDFAHHPTAVKATVQSAAERWPSRRIVAVFEPRSNSSRRKVFEEGYAHAFEQAGAVFLSRPPFRHNDRAEDFMDVDAVLYRIRQTGIPAEAAEGADDLLPLILEEIRPGDVALIMSNGGFGGIHDKLLEALRDR